MTRTTMSLHFALIFAALSQLSPPRQPTRRTRTWRSSTTRTTTNVFMPFVPAIKIKSGKILWLAGTTALPVYHDHPHKRDEIQKYMVNDLEAQTRAAMDGIKQTLDASGASFKDVVHFFVFRARPRMGRHRQGQCGDQFLLRAV